MREQQLKKKLVPVSVDDGNAEIKIVTHDWQLISLPALVREGGSGITRIAADSSDSEQEYVVKHVGGERIFTAGATTNTANVEQLQDYQVSDHNRVLVTHALRVAGYGNTHVDLICGLPLRRFYREVQAANVVELVENEAEIQAKQEHLFANNVEVRSAGKHEAPPKIASVDVCAENVAAYFDILYDLKRDGNKYELVRNETVFGSTIAVVDIGGRTTDISVVRRGNLIGRYTRTINKGMLDVYRVLRALLVEMPQIGNGDPELVDDALVREAVRTGRYSIGGVDHDVARQVRRAREEVATVIRQQVSQVLGDGRIADRVLMVGGGVAGLSRELTSNWFERQIDHEAPTFANARGMRKWIERRITLNGA